MPEERLRPLLREIFGHEDFRPSQEEVCRRAARGQDVMLVMPTGAGKSLCYQLPGLARGGTTLVVSPLLSLIEDQVSKLQSLNISADRIHSGRDRQDAREVCRRYLDGSLSFLFIAPERLSVPGFPEMLAKRQLSLIAIDEAHCISQWGHDFRPEYRMLGARLPMFRPAPILALTATATPEVQNDIASQLGIDEAGRFIRGFRRDNLHIEALPLVPSRRADTVLSILRDPARRPAIVYCNSRRDTESLAQSLGGSIQASAYHAGLSKDEREQTQTAFANGSVDVVVATVAFGMGIDKANVRTVVHAGLPASVESYYQEIGRAGRDGKQSCAVLLYSYVDKKTHEFLLKRSYPEIDVLLELAKKLKREPLSRDDLRDKSKLEDETFERAIEQLWVHGGIVFDAGDMVTLTGKDFLASYRTQRAARFAQLDGVTRYAEGSTCRMNALVSHFGEDTGDPCGLCDGCSTDHCIARTFREPTAKELSLTERILTELCGKSRTMGQLVAALAPETRDTVSHLIDALARAGAVSIENATFEKDGETISFLRIRRSDNPPPMSLRVGETTRGQKKTGRKREIPAESNLAAALRLWRKETAKEDCVPAFRIMSDRVLFEIADARPHNVFSLQNCNGVGPILCRKYGEAIIKIVESHA